MISLLHGMLHKKMGSEIIIDVGGVGFQVITAPDEIVSLKLGEKVVVHTYLNVREDALELYGFLSPERLQFFKILIQVSGIGPRIALQITAAVSFEDFKRAILMEDTEYLKKLPGVGKKMAQKMVFELKDKLKGKKLLTVAGSSLCDGNGFAEAREALEGLGFSYSEIEGLLKEAAAESGEGASSDVLVRYVLQRVGNREV